MNTLTRSCLIFLYLSQLVWTQQIAITFDDSPESSSKLFHKMERCKLIIDGLKKSHVSQAVFFSIGKRAKSAAGTKLIHMYSNAGHLIANHSFNHWAYKNKSSVEYTDDILKAEQVIAQFPTFKKWYRSPQLQEGETHEKRNYLFNFLNKQGYKYGYVTIDTYEFYIDYLLQQGLQKGKQFNKDNLRKLYLDHMWKAVLFYDNVATQYISQPVKHTLLLHENDVAAMFIIDLVELLRNKGCTIITAEEAYTDNPLDNAPDVLLNNQGRVMALASANGYTGPFRSEDENRQAIEDMFVEYAIWNN